MDRQLALQTCYKNRLEVLNCIKFLEAVKKIEGYDIINKQFNAQRESVILRLRKEDDKKKIYRLQGRLNQIEELFSLESRFQQELITIEKGINELSKGMNDDDDEEKYDPNNVKKRGAGPKISVKKANKW